jgi:hypothetical protein
VFIRGYSAHERRYVDHDVSNVYRITQDCHDARAGPPLEVVVHAVTGARQTGKILQRRVPEADLANGD